MPNRFLIGWRRTLEAAPGLSICALLMVPDIFYCAYGLATDHTVITGVPAWEKPMKFALSTLIYTASLAVIVRYTTAYTRLVRLCEFLAGSALALEIVIIDAQAARHTTSHFNITTRVDAALWATMGFGIAVLWISSILLTGAIFHSSYHSRSWTAALRWGMVIAILGMGSGAFMAVPSRAQRAASPLTHHLGGHTIGGVDGGPGLPLLNWSTQHGDVRAAHFVGMHAIQFLFLIGFFLERLRLPERRATRLVYAFTLSYGSFFGLLLAEALLRDPITADSRPVILTWALWFAASGVLVLMANRESASHKGLYTKLGATT